jgi:hypothetical protein
MGELGAWVQYAWAQPVRVRELRFVFDSDLDRPEHNANCRYPMHIEPVTIPQTLTRAFRIEVLDENGGWATIVCENNNYQRLVCIQTDAQAKAIRFVPEATWGAARAHLFAWDIEGQG